MVSVPQIIATINPDLYYDYKGDKKSLENFKNLIKEKGHLEAAKEAKAVSLKLDEDGGLDLRNGYPVEYKLKYDSPTETLEPIYFFILDLVEDFGFSTEKLVDNFVSSPGSAHFGEMGQRASIMQQQGSKLLADMNTVIRSIISLIYDLREIEIRIQSYEDLKDNSKKDAATLSLKQIWMDKVDIQKGNSSIKAMALGGGGFSTLLNAFLAVNSEKDIENLDLNQIVKRILKPRLAEFQSWVKISGAELKKRFEIEKTYLKSQVNSLKLYTNWAKPYLKAAEELGMASGGRKASLVKMFNTILLELTVLAKRKASTEFPKALSNYNPKREYYQIVLIDFEFRGIPQKTQQGYVAGGKAQVAFKGYVLNDEELKLFYELFEKSDISDVLGLVEGITSETLGQLNKDIEYFIGEEKEEKKEKEKKPSDNSNPFLALFGAYNSKKEKTSNKKTNTELSSKDKRMEKEYILPQAYFAVGETVFTFFDIYKKAHGMASYT